MDQSTRMLQPAAIDPLAASLAKSGGGSALYVINLCASMTPIANSDKAIPGFESYRVYQVSRKEDGRIRYRLRLGFFSDESEAETALACVREHYPTAFATSLCDEDQRHTRGFAAADRPAPVAAPASAPMAVAVPATSSASAASRAPSPASSPSAAKAAPPAAPASRAPAPAKGTNPTNRHTEPAGPPAQPAKAAPSISNTQRVATPRVDSLPAVEIEWTPSSPPTPAKAAAPAAAPGHKATAHPPLASATPATTVKPAAAARQSSELSLAAEPVPTASARPTKPAGNEPFHVGKGVELPVTTLSLELEPAPAAAPKAPPAVVTRAGVQANPRPTHATSAAKPVPAKPAPAKPAPPAANGAPPKAPALVLPKPPVVLGDDVPLPDLDSTQTIRALTPAELDDEAQPRWFAVQLAVSEQPINLDTMPHLDIFAAYRLYSVASAGGGKILHHLRIGFFKEDVSADAVSGYLKTFFATPTVLRVSAAEYARFSAGPTPAAAPESKAKVIDMAAARDRAAPREIPVVTVEVTPNPAASGRYPQPNTSASGVQKQLPPTAAAKQPASAPRGAVKTKTAASGKHRTLNEALLAEAREIELSESAIRRLPKNGSLLSKLFGKK